MDEEPHVEQEPRAGSRWYGWQTLTVDGAALVLGLAGAGLGSADGAGLALGGYLLGAPTVHLVHDRAGVGLASLGLRIGAPLVGVGVAAASADCDTGHDFCGLGEAILGSRSVP
jgi:hypothetical protein